MTSSKAWFNRLQKFLHSIGFNTSKAYQSLFIFCKDSHVILLLVYVHDIILTASSPQLITDILQALKHEFLIQNIGQLQYFLGIEVWHSPKDITMNQTKYLTDLLLKSGVQDAKDCMTPMATTPPLHKIDGTSFANQELFRQLVGALQYATLTRPENRIFYQ